MFGQDGGAAFVCECGNRSCTKALTLPRVEYEAIRAHARRFLIALDHENPEIERIVKQNGHIAVVETFVGEASRIPEETDPRSDGTAARQRRNRGVRAETVAG